MAGLIHENQSKRACLTCGAELQRKRYNGTLEDNGRFRRRKFCSLTCAHAAQVKPTVTRRGYLARARKQLGPCCEQCGATAHLSIHHKDRDWRNNDPANLSTLCASCHTSLHHSAGEIVKRLDAMPCKYCGRMVSRRSACEGCRTRIKVHGTPYPTTGKLRY